MSSRRSTRAGSRAASASGAAPVDLGDIPTTPAQRRRLVNTTIGLPPVPLKTSTAYGAPAFIPVPRVLSPPTRGMVDDALNRLIEPIDPNRARSATPRRRRGGSRGTTPGASSNVGGPSITARQTATPDADRTYSNESGIFGDAQIDSSVVDPSDLSNIPEIPEYDDHDIEDDEVISFKPTAAELRQQKNLEEQARLARVNTDRNVQLLRPTGRDSRQSGPYTSSGNSTSHIDFFGPAKKVLALIRRSWDVLEDLDWERYAKYFLGFLLPLAALITLAVLSSAPGTYHWHGVGHPLRNAGQFIPSGVAHPFEPADSREIRKRLSAVESDIITIKQSLKGVDFKAVKQLQQMLPDLMVVKKGKDGQLQIPKDFWRALQSKIKADETLVRESTPSTGKPSSSDGFSEKKARKLLEDEWAKYLTENDAKLNRLTDEAFVERFPKMLEQHDVVSKDSLIRMINREWDDKSSDLSSQVGKLSKEVDRSVRDISALKQHGTSKLSKEEMKSIASEVFKLIPNAQLKATAESNLRANDNWGKKRVNHFSTNMGTIVNAALTSPSYLFPSQNVGFFKWFALAVIHSAPPRPQPAIAALRSWEEAGDCWCSPSTDPASGYGPSLAVLLKHSIYPEEVVIEHIAPSASLQPGATPREMELLAFIPDPEKFKAVSELSAEMFKNGQGEETGKLMNYVRVATWVYDPNGPNNVQGFEVQLDLKSFGAYTSRLIVRSKNNWGGDEVPYTCLYRVRMHGEVVGDATY